MASFPSIQIKSASLDVVESKGVRVKIQNSVLFLLSQPSCVVQGVFAALASSFLNSAIFDLMASGVISVPPSTLNLVLIENPVDMTPTSLELQSRLMNRTAAGIAVCNKTPKCFNHLLML